VPFSSIDEADAAARLAGLLDSAMDAVITIDEAQRIILYNRAAEMIFGWPAAEVRGCSLDMLIPERYRPRHADHVREFGRTGVTSRRMGGSTVVFGRRASGEEFPVDASISQVDTPKGKLFTVILRDVTERVRAEQEQARLAARMAGLIDSAMDGIITVDEQQHIVQYNRAAEAIFGRRAVEVMGHSLDLLIPERYRAAHRERIRRFGMTRVTSRRMGDRNLIYGLRANGDEFPMEASISQLDTPDGKLYTVILRDVTERVSAQRELATFAAEATSVREQEKSRIARELHDELAQSLTALKMDTIWLRDNLGDTASSRDKLSQMLGMLDASVAAVRRIAADLRPLVLDDLGLVPAIEWLAQNFSQRTGVACELEVDEDLELGEPHATGVFRIVQESLVNVGKHARAEKVEVRLVRRGDELVITVQDDGVGFRLSSPRKPQSLGLVGLRERAHLLRGEVRLASQPGYGTRVEARIPLGDAEEAA